MILICRACLAGPAAGDSGIMETRSGAGTRAANDTSVVTEEALSRHINCRGRGAGEQLSFSVSPKVGIIMVRAREVTGWRPLARRQ